jgi:hypothetical protein
MGEITDSGVASICECHGLYLNYLSKAGVDCKSACCQVEFISFPFSLDLDFK